MSQKIKFLFVDDDPKVLHGLRRTLNHMRSEWDIAFAENGPKALACLAEQSFDVLVTDLRMPGMDGSQLLKKVREEYPHIIRIALSGQTSQEIFLQAMGPLHQYLSKPCNTEILKETVDRIFAVKKLVKNESLYRVISQLEALPVLSSIKSQLLLELESEDSTIHHLANLISQDIGLSTKILQIANSAYFGVPKQSQSIAQAVIFLGCNMIKYLIVSSQLFSHFSNIPLSGFSLEKLWHHSITVGQWAKAIAEKENGNPEIITLALLTGLVHDIGKLILATYLPEKYQEVIQRQQEDADLAYMVERQIIGITHAEVGAYLLGLWGFHAKIVEAVACHHLSTSPTDTCNEFFPFVYAANYFTQEMDSNTSAENDSVIFQESYLAKPGLTQCLSDWRKLNPLSSETNNTLQENRSHVI